MALTPLPGRSSSTGATSSGVPTPADYGYKAWAFDPGLSTNTAISHVAGRMGLTKLTNVPTDTPITRIDFYVGSAGATVGDVGVTAYDSTGALLASAVNTGNAIASAFQSTGVKQITVPSFAVPSNGIVRVGIWFGTSGTLPGLLRLNSTFLNAALSTADSRGSTAGSGITTTPPNPLGTQTQQILALWCALAT